MLQWQDIFLKIGKQKTDVEGVSLLSKAKEDTFRGQASMCPLRFSEQKRLSGVKKLFLQLEIDFKHVCNIICRIQTGLNIT